MQRPSSTARVGSLEWERLPGPPLSLAQKASVLGVAAVVVLANLAGRLGWQLRKRRLIPARIPAKVDLSRWVPPSTRAAREAEECLRDVAMPAMVNHSFRTYYFSAIAYELAGSRTPIDRETLYVAALLHDVGLFEPSPLVSEHYFTVAGARAARRITAGWGWEDARQDRVAVAIPSNLNAFVPVEPFGAEAHFMRVGGLVVRGRPWLPRAGRGERWAPGRSFPKRPTRCRGPGVGQDPREATCCLRLHESEKRDAGEARCGQRCEPRQDPGGCGQHQSE